MNKVEIDFYKEFGLPRPIVCGLVHKVTSPKGIRKVNKETDMYEYRLNNELTQIYDDKPAEVNSGLYWVMDIYKGRDGQLRWNHYLIVLDADEGEVYAVAEFKGCTDSTWIKKALPYIKAYFAEDELESIEIEPYRAPKTKKTGWGRIK